MFRLLHTIVFGMTHVSHVQFIIMEMFRYLRGTLDHGICYVRRKRLEIRGYCDASCNSCSMTGKSVTKWVTAVGGTALS